MGMKDPQKQYLQEMFGLSDTTAVITGGAGVIAGALAEALLAAGARVALWELRQEDIAEALRRLEAAVPGASGRLYGRQVDASEEAACGEAFAATEAALGPPNLLLNGVGGNRGKFPLVEQEVAVFQQVLQLNLVAGLLVPTKVFAARWIQRGQKAAIVNIASMASYVPLSGVWAYDAAKAGVLNLTQAAAKELAPHGIRVNALAPGFFLGKQNRALLVDPASGELTARGRAIIERTPYGRFGEPAELAGALLFLASPRAAGFVTGVCIPVDGGYLVDNI
jgi:NAD(P)-dependent dehydrogenase (short-subunit alcohol dehydrogenase family)